MNCDQALDAMLDADVAELSPTASTPLGEHLRDCTWCHRVGRQLVDDTRRLATEMAMPVVGHRPRWSRRFSEAAPLAVAAGILVMLTLNVVQQQDVDRGPRLLPTVVVNVSVPGPLANVSEVAPVPPVRTVVTGVAVAPLRAFPAPTPIAPVAMALPVSAATPAHVVTSNAVSVTPPVGTRAVVMQTGDPKLVVVWLYDPEERR